MRYMYKEHSYDDTQGSNTKLGTTATTTTDLTRLLHRKPGHCTGGRLAHENGSFFGFEFGFGFPDIVPDIVRDHPIRYIG